MTKLRKLFSKDKFFGSTSGLEGQLSIEERKLLYTTALETKPELSLECGTWKGLGSTFFIAEALKKNNKGHLHTFEVDPELHATAVKCLKKKKVDSYVTCHLADFLTTVKSMHFKRVGFVFLDGPEDAEYQLQCLTYLESVMTEGGVVFLHDTKKEKCRLVHSHVASNPVWRKFVELDTSTGMMGLRFTR